MTDFNLIQQLHEYKHSNDVSTQFHCIIVDLTNNISLFHIQICNTQTSSNMGWCFGKLLVLLYSVSSCSSFVTQQGVFPGSVALWRQQELVQHRKLRGACLDKQCQKIICRATAIRNVYLPSIITVLISVHSKY